MASGTDVLGTAKGVEFEAVEEFAVDAEVEADFGEPRGVLSRLRPERLSRSDNT